MTDDRFAGKTVNERLFECGAIADFDLAAKIRNRDKMIEILLGVDLTEGQAIQNADAILADPERYGY